MKKLVMESAQRKKLPNGKVIKQNVLVIKEDYENPMAKLDRKINEAEEKK